VYQVDGECDVDEGESLVYKRNSVGFWEEVEPPRASNRTSCEFGKSVDCDGNLVVVTDAWLCGATFYLNSGYIFRQKGGQWVEVQVLDKAYSGGIEQIIVSGKTIAVAYTKTISLVLDGDQLLSLVANGDWWDPVEFFIVAFRRDDLDKNFTEVQSVNVTYGNITFGEYSQVFALSNDLLAVGSEDNTVIFRSNQAGVMILLDHRG
jgi:hypothetical protein